MKACTADPYQVEILRRQGRYPVRIIIEEVLAPIRIHPRHGWVDVNTNGTHFGSLPRAT